MTFRASYEVLNYVEIKKKVLFALYEGIDNVKFLKMVLYA